MRQKHWVLAAVLTGLMMLASACTSASVTAPTAQQMPTPAASSNKLAIVGAGLEISMSFDELKASKQVEISTKNISSTGEVTKVTAKGISLTALLLEKGVKQADLDSVTFTAADGYIMTVPKDILKARELFILCEMDGKALTTPRSAVPEERAMYWVRDLVKVELSTQAAVSGSVKKIILFKSGAAKLESAMLNNRGDKVASMSLNLFCKTYLKKLPTGSVVMRAEDGFEKGEKADVFLTCYVTYTDQDAPLYFSETLADGMRVKKLMAVLSGDEAVYFGDKTIKIPDLLTKSGLAKAKSYDVTAVDGFKLTVSHQELINGSLQYVDGSFTAVFPDVTKSGGNVKNVLSISIVD